VHAAVWDGYRPEEALLVDSGIEIVDLLGIRIRSRTREDVQSNESKGATVNFAITPDKRSSHEAIIGLEEKVARFATGFGPDSSASHSCQANEALEVGDQGWLGGWTGKKDVKQRPLGAKQLHAPGDRVR
jgi:hypothetical protein